MCICLYNEFQAVTVTPELDDLGRTRDLSKETATKQSEGEPSPILSCYAVSQEIL